MNRPPNIFTGIEQSGRSELQLRSTKKEFQILYVEDDPFWQNLLCQVLKKFYGDRVLVRCTRSFHSADNLIFNHQFDLIIVDQTLHGQGTGLDFWRSCRRNRVYVPMVMLSAMSWAEFTTATVGAGLSPILVEKRKAMASLRGVLDCYVNLSEAA